MTAAEQRKKKAQQMADYYAARGDSTSAGAKAAQRAVSKAEGKTPYSATGAAVQKYRANKPTTVQDLYANRPTRQNNQTQAPNPALAQSIVNTVLGTGRGRSVIAGVDNAHKIAGQEPNQQIRIQPGAARNSSARQQMEAAQTKELGSVERIGTLERIGKSARSGLKDWAAGYMDYAAAGTAAENRAGTELTRSALAGYKKQLDNERAVMASYERGEGLYDEKDYAVAREQAENLRRYINAYDKALGANEEISGQTAAESEKLKQSAAMDSEEATSGLGKVGTRLIRGVGTTVQNLLDSAVGGFGPRAAYPSIAARVYGQATQNALNDGKSREGAVRYGLAQAAAELAPELFFSGNPLTDAADGGIVSEAAESLLSNPRAKKLRDVLGAIGESKYVNNFLTKLGADAFGEGVEEVVTQGLNDIIDRITYGDEKDRSTPQDYAEAFWGGVIGSVYGNALRPSGVINNAREDIAGLRQQTSQNSVDDAINRLAQSTGDNPEALRNVIAPVWQNEQRLINNLAAYYAGERGLTPADAASVAQSFATRFYSDLAAEQQAASQPAQQTAQEAAQQAPQGIATNAENAPSGVFNTAQDAQEAKPTQTVADIYANRPTRQQNIDNAAQAGYTNNSIDSVSGGVTDDAGRSAETNRDGVSGSDQTGYAVGQRRTGLDRASVGPRFVLSDQAKSTIQSRGVAFAETHDVSADSAAFSAALDEARASDAKNGWAVSPKAQQEIDENGIRVYMNENSSVGFGIAPDGDIEAVFANKQKGAPKGSAASIIPQAIAAGGTKLDCYGKVLVDIYSLGGFVPVARVAFNPEYANDGWDASKGTPYIYFMMATDTDADSVVANYGKYKVWTQAELDALPLMEYDEAYAYRDSLLVQRQGEAVAASPAVTQSQNTATATDGRDMGSVSPEDSTGAAPAGFDPVSQWQMEADAYHPVNEAAAQTTMEERGRAPMDIPTTDRNGRQVSKLVSTLVNANITTNEAASALAEDARNGVFSAIPYTDDAAAHFGDRRQAYFITDSKAGRPVQLRLCGSPFVWPKSNLNIHDLGLHLKGIFAALGQLIATQGAQLRPQPQPQHMRRVLPRGAARVTPTVIVQTGARADAVILADEEVFVFLRCVRFESVFPALMRVILPQPFGGFHPKLQLDASVAGKTGQGIELPNGGRAAMSRLESVHSGMARGSIPLLPTVVRQHIFEYVFCLTELVVQTVGGVKIVGDDSYGFGSCHVLSPEEHHRHAVGGKLHVVVFQVEIIDGLYQPNAADLEQIVHIFAASGEFLDHGQNQPQIAADELIACACITGLCFLQKCARLLAFQNRQGGCIHAADLHFSLQLAKPPFPLRKGSFSRRGVFHAGGSLCSLKVIDKKTWRYYWEVFMNREEILEKSRAENKNKDIYEQEILKRASSSAVIVMMVLATVFFVVQIFVGGGMNWGIWALVFSANMTTLWVKYIKLRRKHELVMAIAYTMLVAAFSGAHIYHLIVSSAII